MKIAAICCTYKRPAQLATAVECFLRQDYPLHLREMIVLDDAGQYAPTAMDGVPGVKLVVSPHRFRTLGEKRNATAALVSADVDAYCVWDDDDIYLPWHMQAAATALAEADYTIPTTLCIEKNGRLQRKANQYLFHGAWSFRRAAFEQVHGYPFIQSGQDQGLLRRFKSQQLRRADPLRYDPRPSYVYRWFTADCAWHLSAMGGGGYERLAGVNHARVERFKPGWEKDWLALWEAL
jgi:glycosyltransferase involved in cell wall biosynthesis